MGRISASQRPISIAIVGAGPSGFYAAEALLARGLDCRIDILESLPTPYGLIRFGVAPDHEQTKRVARSYERTATDRRVHYYGNVKVGEDATIRELRAIYDALIIAVGASLDRKLAVDGGDLEGVYGAAEFVGWYNGHPDYLDHQPNLDSSAVAIIGNGNVALDIARVLVKTPQEMAGTDLPDYAGRAIQESPIRDVYLIGRRGPLQAKWTNVELREMGRLADCQPIVEPSQLPERVEGEMSPRERRLAERNLATLRGFLDRPPGKANKRLHFLFYVRPTAVLGEERVEGLRLERTKVEEGRTIGLGESVDLPCGAVIAAIGYRSRPIEGVPFDEKRGVVANRRGRVAKGLYVVGWAMRGPTGVIGSNKADADLIAEHVANDLAAGLKPGRPALEELLEERAVAWVSFEDWKRIEEAEIAAAHDEEAPRRKLIRIRDMLEVLQKVELN